MPMKSRMAGSLVQARRSAARVNSVGTVRYMFTHFSLELHIVPSAEPEGQGWWQPLDRLDQAGLPTLYRHAAQLVLKAAQAA